MEYPKLLLITTVDIFTDNSSSSFTVRSFLGNWPKDRAFQIVCEDFNSGSSRLISDYTYLLGHDSINVGSWLINGNRSVLTHLHKPTINNHSKKKQSIKTQLYQFCVAVYSELPYRFNKELLKFVNEAHPDVIYSVLTPSRATKFARRLAKKLDISLIPHFMDDWSNVYLASAGLIAPLRLYFNNLLRKIIIESPTCLCISELMCKEYSHRYGTNNMVPLMHSVSDCRSPKRLYPEGQINMLYAGSLYLDRHVSLIKLCDCLNTIHSNKCTISIYCPILQWEELQANFRDYSFVQYGGFVSQDELMNRIEDADALILIESFDEDLLQYTRLSMSTKIPEYLSSGRPIIAVGNKRQGSISYLLDHNAAYVACGLNDIALTIRDFLNGENMDSILANARDLFVHNHSNGLQEKKFLDVIINASANSKTS